MQKTLDEKIRAVLLYIDGVRKEKEICEIDDIVPRTFRRRVRAYRNGGIDSLNPRRRGPPKGTNSITKRLEQKIIRLKQRHTSWGARRIKYQYDLPCHWRTVHNVIKRHGLLVRIKPKPQPSKRFQRRYVDSMWQGNTFQFRISGMGRVYVTGFADDRSRYRVISKAYLNKSAAKADLFGQWKTVHCKRVQVRAYKMPIRPVYGRPYHPRGRGKIESYHKILYKELITQVGFSSLSHFKRDLGKFDGRYNFWRKSQALGWSTPASAYHDRMYFNKKRQQARKSGH